MQYFTYMYIIIIKSPSNILFLKLSMIVGSLAIMIHVPTTYIHVCFLIVFFWQKWVYCLDFLYFVSYLMHCIYKLKKYSRMESNWPYNTLASACLYCMHFLYVGRWEQASHQHWPSILKNIMMHLRKLATAAVHMRKFQFSMLN